MPAEAGSSMNREFPGSAGTPRVTRPRRRSLTLFNEVIERRMIKAAQKGELDAAKLCGAALAAFNPDR